MTVIIVCGGTAGHINPGLSIASEIRRRYPQSEIIFIGAGRDMEKQLIPQAGYELINIEMSGIKRGFSPGVVISNIKTVLKVLSAQKKAAKLLDEIKPDAVAGTGGYICYPVLKAAAKRKIPTFLHESNALPGMTVKALSGIVDKIMITYTGFEKYYKYPGRLVRTGTPTRMESGNTGEPAEEGALPSGSKSQGEKPLVVSFWGSLGAQRMNEIMTGFIDRNIKEKEFHHIHATGNSKGKFDKMLSQLGLSDSDIKPPYADIRDYIEDMPAVMRKANLILCRAGGISLAELTALGKPSILIPSPYVPDNVQYINASQLSQCGAAVLIEEADCSSGYLYDTVTALLKDRQKLDYMAAQAGKLGCPDAASDIADIILSTIEKAV